MGGFFLVWSDGRTDYDALDIFAQSIDENGDVLWANDGVPISTAVGYQYRAQVISDLAGGAIFSWAETTGDRDIYSQRVNPTITPVVDGGPVHAEIILKKNYPNPFNPQTTIAFEIPIREAVSMRVFDMTGRLVRELIIAEEYTSGRYEVVWNGRDDAGRQVASGTYFYRLEARSYSETKRMVLVK